MIYIFLVLTLIIIAHIEILTKDRKFSNYSSFYVAIFLVFFASLRNNVGADWNSYYEFYINGTDAVEVGYSTLNNLFSQLSIPYYIFLTVINGFSIFFLYKFLQNHSHFKNIALLLFFCDLYLYFNLSGVRQAIAISFTCYSLNFAIRRNFLNFIFFVTIASLFHLTAIIFLIAYFIPRNKISKSQIFIFGTIFVFGTLFINYFSEIITLYTNKNAFFYTNLQVNSDNLKSLYYIGIAKRSIILLLLLIFGKDYLQKSNFRYFINIYLFGFFIYLATYMVSPDIGVRLSSYFIILDIVIIGNLAYYNGGKKSLLILSIISIVALYKIVGYVNDETYLYHTILGLN